MEFTIKDAARIAYGEEVADRLQEAKDEERAEKAKHRAMSGDDIKDEKWGDVVEAEYKSIPSFWGGGLLMETINEQERGMNHDDLIEKAYVSGDKVAASDELFKLLDWYRGPASRRTVPTAPAW